jgi:hypothetical protein
VCLLESIHQPVSWNLAQNGLRLAPTDLGEAQHFETSINFPESTVLLMRVVCGLSHDYLLFGFDLPIA